MLKNTSAGLKANLLNAAFLYKISKLLNFLISNKNIFCGLGPLIVANGSANNQEEPRWDWITFTKSFYGRGLSQQRKLL